MHISISTYRCIDNFHLENFKSLRLRQNLVLDFDLTGLPSISYGKNISNLLKMSLSIIEYQKVVADSHLSSSALLIFISIILLGQTVRLSKFYRRVRYAIFN